MNLLIHSEDILINQLQKESLNIAKSFDGLCSEDLSELSELFSQTLNVISEGQVHNKVDSEGIQIWKSSMLLNVGNLISSAAYVLRGGHLVSSGIILRSAVESLAVCIHAQLHPEDLDKIKDGSFSYSKAIKTAKSVHHIFGLLYGALSNHFTHTGPLHQNFQGLDSFNRDTPGLNETLITLRTLMWLYYMVAEFSFINELKSPRYWFLDADGNAVYKPSEEEQAWQSGFLDGSNIASDNSSS
jgi:hypothetical protein